MKYVLKELHTSLSVTGVVNLHFFEFQENYYTSNETHPFYELVYVSSGALHVHSESYDGVLTKGKMIVHMPDEGHSLSCDVDSAPTVIIIGFTCEGEPLSRLSTPFTLTASQIKKLAEIVKEGRNVFSPPFNIPLYDMKKKKYPLFASEQMLQNLLEYFLISALREMTYRYINDAETADVFSIGEIVTYLDDNFTEKITLDELAFIFKTNRSTLCRQFKAFTGKTIVEYINDKKLDTAKYKISHTDKTFTTIADELNFESIHYFTRFFKKLTGISPKDYRRQYQSSDEE